MQRLPRLIGPRKAAEMAVNGESVNGGEAVRLGLAHELHPSSTALVRAFEIAREVMMGSRDLERADWDVLAAEQATDVEALFEDDEVSAIMASPTPSEDDASGLATARSHAARTALLALRAGYQSGFSDGLANDARLFGEVVASPSGQYWVDRFLAKDPEQSLFLTLLRPVPGQNPIRASARGGAAAGGGAARVPVSRSGPSIGQSFVGPGEESDTLGNLCADARLGYRND